MATAFMTPTTALLNSYFENDLCDTPQVSRPKDDEDYFNNAMVDVDISPEVDSDPVWPSLDYEHDESMYPDHPARSAAGIANDADIKQGKLSSEQESFYSMEEYIPSPRSFTTAGNRFSEDLRRTDISGAPEDTSRFLDAISERFSWANGIKLEVLKPEQEPCLLPLSPPFSTPTSHTSTQSPRNQACSATSLLETTGTEAGTMDNLDPEVQPPRKRRSNKKQLTTQQKDTKRRAFLDRNRVAAGKSRSKKRGWMQQLEEDARCEKKRNEELKCDVDMMMDEVMRLRQMVQGHAHAHKVPELESRQECD